MIQDTSLEAYESVDHDSREMMVLNLLHKRRTLGLTADEAAEHFGLFHNSVAPALTHLKDDGVIYDSGERRLTRSGRRAIVWRIRP